MRITKASIAVAGVLVGGKSTRMKSPKPLLPHPSGATYLEHVVHTANAVADEVVLLGACAAVPQSLKGTARLEDRFPGRGPMSGLETLLRHAGNRWTLLIACDMPMVNAALLEELGRHLDDQTDAVAFSSAPDRRVHACCAAYHGRLAAIVTDTLKKGGSVRLQSLLANVRTTILFPTAFQQEALSNVNTMDDLKNDT